MTYFGGRVDAAFVERDGLDLEACFHEKSACQGLVGVNH